MSLFGSRPKPVQPNPALNEHGFVDPDVKPYSCGCGQEEKTSAGMDRHIKRDHPDG
jgi:hypothetical protein